MTLPTTRVVLAAAAIPAVLDLTIDRESVLREAARATLRRLLPWAGAVVPALTERLQTGEGEVRWLAARLLSAAGPAAKDAIPALREMAASKNSHYAKAAETALKQIDVVVRLNEALFQPHAAKAQAPVWMQRAGLEWLFRLLTEPRRLGRRYLRQNPPFLFHVARQLLAERRTRQRLQ